ncbi:LysM peptidoglycan-binding domain-containing protein [Phocea massiliensis]|uniref:LysM peptidoglycan-binding domain-containing protein n=1 Tax=Merdimmobilis hominis TaxID=2897707 RepID=A0A939BF74_9FIRM|nr:LysM peptidoglycan-binding domain-containing protein [Merdimmobilis hominis]
MTTKNVIDISAYQPKVDYQTVKNSGIDGVILRCGLTYWGKQNPAQDACFQTHYEGFRAVNMPVGVYYYSAADSVEKAREEAAFVKSILKGKQFAYPVYYDVENEQRMGPLSKATLTSVVEAFCTEMENAGYFVGVYANTNYFQNKLDHARLAKKYTLWLADYRAENANRTLLRDMFQYTSKGTVSGIAGNVDLNECYKDFPSIIKEAGKNGFSVVETITPPSKPSEKTYTVKTGDSFWKIAQEQLGDGTRYQELAAYNGMRTDDVIYPGQVLKLPAGTQTAVPNKAYTVEKGDSFWKIAQEQLGDGTRYQELAAYNGMRADDVIYPGQVLKLP